MHLCIKHSTKLNKLNLVKTKTNTGLNNVVAQRNGYISHLLLYKCVFFKTLCDSEFENGSKTTERRPCSAVNRASEN